MARRFLQRFIRFTIGVSACMVFVVAPSVAAQAISHAYDTTDGVQKGMIVMLDPNDKQKIKLLSSKNDASMLGVVVSANDTILSVGGDGTTSQVYVANDGKYEVLVSTQNGAIKRGDIITISALDGIGMKADTTQTVVLGKALTGFDGKNNISGSMVLKTKVGNRTVQIGMIVVDISIAHNPIQVSVNGPPVPTVLKKAGEIITGKSVSTWRLYIALTILLVTVFITGSLLYGGVRSSLIAIGRNPLAKKVISRGLIQVIVMGVIIFVLGLFSIYLILKL